MLLWLQSMQKNTEPHDSVLLANVCREMRIESNCWNKQLTTFAYKNSEQKVAELP